MMKVHKIFEGRKPLGEAEMTNGMISGGALSLASKLEREHGWNGTSLLAAPIATLEAGTVVDTHWSLIGTLQDLQFSANQMWPKGDKKLLVNIRIPSLSIFTFPATKNVSYWLERNELDVDFKSVQVEDERDIFTNLTFDEACELGAGEFSIRCHLTPKDHKSANVWVAGTPYSKTTLTTRLGNSANTFIAHT